MRCAGSRYTYAPNLLPLKEAFEKGVKRLAVVGVPCQIDGLRYLQYGSIVEKLARWYREHVVFSMGLFCSEVFTYDGLVSCLRETGISTENVAGINIKGRLLVKLVDGREVGMPLKPLHRYVRPACGFCKDYSAELADISVGGLGQKSWNITVIRTSKGNSLLTEASSQGVLESRPIEEVGEVMERLRRLCKKKRERPSPPLSFEASRGA